MKDRKILEKIISGGQTGVDQGALDAALELDHPCGGWCPKGRKCETGIIPDKYPLQEHISSNYKVRTEANVRDSDGTIVFSYGKPSGGTKLTVDLLQKCNKPFFTIDLDSDPLNFDPRKISDWGHENEVFVLNVAGPRKSKAHGTQVLVEGIMMQILEYTRQCYPIVVETGQ